MSTLPTSGTVRYTDGRIYTVAPLGRTLRLDDIAVRVQSVVWTRSVKVGFKPPGTRIYGLVTLTVTNRTGSRQQVGLTQIWLRDAAGNPILAAASATVPHNLLKMPIPVSCARAMVSRRIAVSPSMGKASAPVGGARNHIDIAA